MLYFSHRKRLARLFEKWAINNNVKICMESMVVYLQINGLIDEGRVIKFVNKSEERSAAHGAADGI